MPKVTRENIKLETKSLPILDKEIGEGRTVRSLFAVMGHVDSVGDKIMPGAFRKTISERFDRIQVLWQHDASAPPVGIPMSLREIGLDEMPEMVMQQWPDATGGLLGEIKYLDTPRGNEILTGIREGAIKENSIGYDTLPGKISYDGDGVRVISEIRLWDVSPVNWGAQEAAVNIKGLVMSPVLEARKDELDPELYEILSTLTATTESALAPELLKVGRVLSARNMTRLKEALATLTELLLSAEPPEDEAEKARQMALTESVLRRLAIAEHDPILLSVR